ncbi:MAG: metallophosphoesterase [Rhizobacter sp.]|nr:metallophosphoesterase [Chlorobiales bacterium]
MLIRILVFFGILLTILGLSQWWAYRTFTALFGHKRFFFWLTVGIVLITLSFFVFAQLRVKPTAWVMDFIYRLPTVYVATTLILSLLFPLYWLIGRAATLGAKGEQEELSRREFLYKAARISLVGLYAVALGDSILSAQRDRIRRYTVRLKDLPEELNGVTIAQLSDIHVGAYWGIERFEEVAEKLKTINHDFLVITGDLVDNSPDDAPVLTAGLNLLSAKQACIAVLGNHDHYAGASIVASAVRASHFTLLRNETLNAAYNGGTISFLGAEDPMGAIDKNDPTNESGLRQAMQSQQGFPVVLMHRPDQWEAVKKLQLPFALCGHTHAGQLAIPFTQITIANIVYKQTIGFYNEVLANGLTSTLFVHAGNGVAGVPVRVGCPPEISVFELRRA